MRTCIAFLCCFFAATAMASTPSSAEMRNRLDAIGKQLPDFKQKLDQLRSTGRDVSYPLVPYTVLENFVGYCKDDLDVSVPSGWGLNAVNGCAARYEPVRDPHGG